MDFYKSTTFIITILFLFSACTSRTQTEKIFVNKSELLKDKELISSLNSSLSKDEILVLFNYSINKAKEYNLSNAKNVEIKNNCLTQIELDNTRVNTFVEWKICFEQSSGIINRKNYSNCTEDECEKLINNNYGTEIFKSTNFLTQNILNNFKLIISNLDYPIFKKVYAREQRNIDEAVISSLTINNNYIPESKKDINSKIIASAKVERDYTSVVSSFINFKNSQYTFMNIDEYFNNTEAIKYRENNLKFGRYLFNVSNQQTVTKIFKKNLGKELILNIFNFYFDYSPDLYELINKNIHIYFAKNDNSDNYNVVAYNTSDKEILLNNIFIYYGFDKIENNLNLKIKPNHSVNIWNNAKLTNNYLSVKYFNQTTYFGTSINYSFINDEKNIINLSKLDKYLISDFDK